MQRISEREWLLDVPERGKYTITLNKFTDYYQLTFFGKDLIGPKLLFESRLIDNVNAVLKYLEENPSSLPANKGSSIKKVIFENRPKQNVLKAADWFKVQKTLGLSAKECLILQEVFNGESQKTAAANIGMLYTTLGRHLRNIYLRINVDNILSAYLRCLETLDMINKINSNKES